MSEGVTPLGSGSRAAHGTGDAVSAVPASIPDADEWEVLAVGYAALTPKPFHASDCAVSRAPAEKPGPCDCDSPATGPWWPVAHYNEAWHGTDVLIGGGTYLYDAETFPEHRPFTCTTIARRPEPGSDEWRGGYGSEYDGEYWHRPEWFMRIPPLPTQIVANGGKS